MPGIMRLKFENEPVDIVEDVVINFKNRHIKKGPG